MLNAPALLTVLSFLLTTLSDSIFGGVLDAHFLAPLDLPYPRPHQGPADIATAYYSSNTSLRLPQGIVLSVPSLGKTNDFFPFP